jgi:FkbM family methyltransferase
MIYFAIFGLVNYKYTKPTDEFSKLDLIRNCPLPEPCQPCLPCATQCPPLTPVRPSSQNVAELVRDAKVMVKGSLKEETMSGGVIKFVKAERLDYSFFFGMKSDGLPDVLPFGHFYGKVEYSVLLALEHGWNHSKPENVVFFDVGANTGWFSMHAAARGFDVYAFDVQPGCVRWIKSEVLINGFHEKITVFNNGVSSKMGYKIDIDSSTCNGGFSFDSQKNEEKSTGKNVLIDTFQLDPLIDEIDKEVIMKIDTEGSEVDILKTMMRSIKSQKIKSLVIEIIPTLWPLKGNDFEEGVKVFQEILDNGYEVYVLFDPNPYKEQAAKKVATPSYIHPELDLWDMVSVRNFMKDRNDIKGGGTNIWIYRKNSLL